jgi:hypothetical protein
MASIQIPKARDRLSEEDIEKAVVDGEQSAEEDKLLLGHASNMLPGVEEAQEVSMGDQEMGE